MSGMITAALNRHRTVLMLFTLLLIIGTVTLINIPKESNPDITVPFVYVSTNHEGISPEDADALIAKPLEKKLRGVDGLKEMITESSFGHVSIQLEFYSDIDIDKALTDVRRLVEEAKGEFPEETRDPHVKEINVALFPVMVVTLSGMVDEAVLYATADNLQTELEMIPGVLEAEMKGKREEIAEIIIDPVRMDQYRISLQEVSQILINNTSLVATGSLNSDAGQFKVKLPGRIEDIPDVLELPIKKSGEHVVLFKDIAVGRYSYKDRTSSAYMNGERAVVLEIKKRIGANIIDTLDRVRNVIELAQPLLPKGVNITLSQDESKSIRNMLNDLFNNVLLATLLVMLVIMAFLGFRSSIMVGIAIPGAFLLGIIAISLMGYTLNMVVLFALILSIGMLVDGAIVVTEYADRRISDGIPAKMAYGEAAGRMAWPIIASTATTLAVFLPLLFWPDVTGEFMKYLPLTLIFTLSASLIMALLVIPAAGSVFVRSKQTVSAKRSGQSGSDRPVSGLSKGYYQTLKLALRFPILTSLALVSLLGVSVTIYGNYGSGTEFFPDTDAEVGKIDIRARGNMSLIERDRIVRQVEKRITDMPEIASIYTKSMTRAPHNSADDVIGVIQMEFVDWQYRRRADDILLDIRQRTSDIAGIILEIAKKKSGPSDGTDVELELASSNSKNISEMVAEVTELFRNDPELQDVRNTLPLNEVDWQITVNREQAIRYGADINSTGALIRMATTGQVVGQFQPEFTDDEVDIVLRYPRNQRTLDQFQELNIVTEKGLVPVSNFMTQTPIASRGNITRRDGLFHYLITANVNDGVNVNEKIKQISEQLKQYDWQQLGVKPEFRGDFEKQQRTGQFLASAFTIAIFLMATILVTQFNSFFQAGLIMSAILLSITGVLIALIIRGEPFGIVMSGVGIIALAGIVVNNNIVLIDTYNRMVAEGLSPYDAALKTGMQRLRPVLLTASTTVIGLLPMVFQWNIDLLNQRITVGAPSTEWWTQLSTAIAGGLTFATVLTLIMTPCLLMIGDQRLRKKVEPTPENVLPINAETSM